MDDFETMIPAPKPQVAVETLIFLDAATQLQIRPWQVVSCAWYEDAMQKGYRSIAAREDLAELAEKGFSLDDEGFVHWLEQSDGMLNSASKLFAMSACMSEGRPLSNAEIAEHALWLSDFYAASDMDSPTHAEQILTTFEAVLLEVQKVMPDARIQKVTLAPSSTTLQ